MQRMLNMGSLTCIALVIITIMHLNVIIHSIYKSTVMHIVIIQDGDITNSS